MNKGSIALLIAFLTSAASVSYAEDWRLVKSVKRLESVAPDYKNDKTVDKQFLDVLDLTEKTNTDEALYAEAKKIATIPTLSQSKYMDSFLYYMLVRSTTLSKTGTAEADYWLNLLKANEKSPHLLPAVLVHMKQFPKAALDTRRDAQFLVDWIGAQKPDMKVRAPEYSRNMFMSYKPRVDFAEGDYPKLYALSYYKGTVTPLAGFLEDETYVTLLGQIKEGREDIMTEMSTILRKNGKRQEASDIVYQLAMRKANAKDFQQAKVLLDDAVKLNPENEQAVKERNRIKLELTYQALTPAAPPAVAPAVSAPQEVSSMEPVKEAEAK